MPQEIPPQKPDSDDNEVNKNITQPQKSPEEVKKLSKRFDIVGVIAAIKSAIIRPDPRNNFYKEKLEARYDMSPEAVSKRLEEEAEKKRMLRSELETEAIDRVRMLFVHQNNEVSERILELLARDASIAEVIDDLGTEALSRPVTSTNEYKRVTAQIIKALKMIEIPE